MDHTLLQRAAQLIEHKRFGDAEKQLQMFLSSDPDSADALSMLAICKSESGKHKEAEDLIKQSISLEPDNDHFLYLTALVALRNEKLKEAETFIKSAIAYNPNEADYFGVIATIKLQQKEWRQALDYADQGLACDADDLTCLNVRSTALLKLDRKEESYQTIREALSQDPENDYTHANMGWGYLERGEHKRALESFRQSLKLNPENELAKSGLVEGLKARYLFYRIFLKYAFWVGNLKAKGQWAFIIGLYLGVRVLRSLAESNSDLAIFLKPIIYAYMVFAISTWLIEPISNLFLRLNVYGRYALSERESMASNFVGIAMAGGIFSAVAYGFLSDDSLFGLVMFFFFMMLPLGSMLKPDSGPKRTILVGYTTLLAIIGLASFFLVDGQTLWLTFLIGVVAFGWIANAFIIK